MRLIAAAAVIGLLSSLSPAMAADDKDNIPVCDGGDKDCMCASPQPRLPEGCQQERITAAGEQTLGVVRGKHYLARKAWQRQVIDKFGERFQRWDKSACQTVECGPGSIAGYSRCTYSAFACAPDVNPRDIDDLRRASRSERPAPEYYERREEERRGGRELGSEEIAEMQRILRREGFSVSVDGQFGEQTSQALIEWQHKNGMHADGEATFRNLELLKRGGR